MKCLELAGAGDEVGGGGMGNRESVVNIKKFNSLTWRSLKC